MWPQFGSLPAGIVPLILILGGLAFSLPVTAATLLRPPAPREESAPKLRAVLVDARDARDAKKRLDVSRLPPLDAAMELTFASGIGDPRILYSDAHRKLVRLTPPEDREPDDAYREEAKRTLESTFARVLDREPTVTEIANTDGRCEFLVSY